MTFGTFSIILTCFALFSRCCKPVIVAYKLFSDNYLTVKFGHFVFRSSGKRVVSDNDVVLRWVLTDTDIWKRYWHPKYFRLQETAVTMLPYDPRRNSLPSTHTETTS